jgi:hypothetical protein
MPKLTGLRLLVRAAFPLCLQNLGQTRVDGKRKLGDFGFGLSYPAVYYTAFH